MEVERNITGMMRLISFQHPVVLFDGVCNLCNSTIRFIIENDRHKKFRYASLQSRTGIELNDHKSEENENFPSLMLIENGIIYRRSEAVLRIAKRLDGLWPVLFGLMIVPESLRDQVYNIISAKRYRFAGKQSTCFVPSPAIRELFIR
jgi:predicted DCC family thiol-disulfide oxidoreductase YuxK